MGLEFGGFGRGMYTYLGGGGVKGMGLFDVIFMCAGRLIFKRRLSSPPTDRPTDRPLHSSTPSTPHKQQQNQVRLLRQMDHPNITKIITVIPPLTVISARRVWLTSYFGALAGPIRHIYDIYRTPN